MLDNMFDFFLAVGNYEDRKVARFDAPWGFVDTVQVCDGSQPFETAVQHPDYNGGGMVIVEAYDTMKEAQVGHDKWVAKMTAKRLPSKLVDCANAAMAKAFLGKQSFPRIKKQ